MRHNLQKEEILEIVEKDTSLNDLMIFNDNFNTFDHVINTLIKFCKHSNEQAEQCTWLIHHRGKCCVKKGDLSMLKPMKAAICKAGIDARIL